MSNRPLDSLDWSAYRHRLRALARGMLGDDPLVDDAVQEVFLSAARTTRRPRRGWEPWLAATLRNRVRNLRRDERRRAEHEARRAAEAPATTVDDEVSGTLELQARILAAVEQLDEPYRTAIVLRYLRELAPPSIAGRLGVPVETVRTRLRRGLAMLRARMDREHGGDRSAWAALLAPLAATAPPPATGPTPSDLSTPAASAAGTATWIGGMMMGKWALATVALGLVVTLLTLRATGPAPSLDSTGEAASALVGPERAVAGAEGAAPSAEPVTRLASRGPRAEDSREVALAAGPSLVVSLDGWLATDRGTVSIALADGRPQMGRSPSGGARGAGHALPSLASVQREGASAVELPLAELLGERTDWPRVLEVVVDHVDFMPGRAWAELAEERDTYRVACSMVRARRVVTGHVVGPDGRRVDAPCAALYRLGADGAPLGDPEEWVGCGDDGAFRLRSAHDGPHAVLFVQWTPEQRARASTAPRTLVLPAGGPRAQDLGTVRLERGLEIRGHVVGGEGRRGELRIAAPESVSAPYGKPFSLSWIDGRFVRATAGATLDAEGGFAAGGLGPLEYRIELVSFRKSRDEALPRLTLVSSGRATTAARAPAAGVVLDPGLVERELVVRSGGQPLDGCRVGLHSPSRSQSIGSGGGNRVVLEHPRDLEVTLRVSHPDHEPFELDLTPELPVEEPLLVELEPLRPRAEWSVEIVSEAADPLAGCALYVSFCDVDAASAATLASHRRQRACMSFGERVRDSVALTPGPGDEALELRREPDRLHVTNLPPGRYEVALIPVPRDDRDTAPLPHRLDLELVAGSHARAEWRVERGALIHLVVAGSPAGELERVRLFGPEGEVGGLCWTSEDSVPGSITTAPFPAVRGRSRAGAVLPFGRYRFELWRGGAVALEHEVELSPETGGEVHIDVTGR